MAKQKHKNKSISGVFAVISSLIVVVIFGFAGFQLFSYLSSRDGNTDGNVFLMTRSATNSDVSLEADIAGTIVNLKDTYQVIPSIDIKGLKIQMSYKDNNNNIIKTVSSSVGNVNKDTTYSFSISHTVSEILAIRMYTYKVIGGSVSYWAK